MYRSIRQIHLFTAFVLTVFVLMYFVSGFVMIFEDSFQRKDTSVSVLERHIPGIGAASGDTLVSLVKESFGVSGQYQVRRNNSGTLLTFRHPGKEVQVVVLTQSDSARCTIRKKNLVSVLHQFHRLHGYYGGPNYVAWAIMYDLAAMSMILFAFTGVFLWYKTEHIRWPGWLILGVFTLLIAFTIYYLHVIH
jgi:hypothetical protein